MFILYYIHTTTWQLFFMATSTIITQLASFPRYNHHHRHYHHTCIVSPKKSTNYYCECPARNDETVSVPSSLIHLFYLRLLLAIAVQGYHLYLFKNESLFQIVRFKFILMKMASEICLLFAATNLARRLVA